MILSEESIADLLAFAPDGELPPAHEMTLESAKASEKAGSSFNTGSSSEPYNKK